MSSLDYRMAENKYPGLARPNMANIIQNVVDMIGYFGDAATSFPSSILLLLMGGALILFSSLVLGYLAAGAAVDYVIPDSIGRTPPRQG